MSFDKRGLQRRARFALHSGMSVPAIYHSPDRMTTVDCTVRVLDRQKAFGDMTGFDFDPAERVASVPEIICLADDLTPVRGGVFSIAADEQHQVETVMPRDGITITSQVSRRSASKVAAEPLTYPGQV